jgi:hypothetical protein
MLFDRSLYLNSCAGHLVGHVGIHSGRLETGVVNIGTIDIDDGLNLDELQKLAAAEAYEDAQHGTSR